jgi:hypothetical protein
LQRDGSAAFEMTTPTQNSRERFLELLRAAINGGALVKLTLGKYRGADATLQNIFARPIALKSGPHLTLVWRHAARDITKNFSPTEALAVLEPLVGGDFLDAHLFTSEQNVQLECSPAGDSRLRLKKNSPAEKTIAVSDSHDREKKHLIPADAPWLRALGVTNDRGRPREGMADKFRQIQKFSELLSHLIAEAFSGSRELSHDAKKIDGLLSHRAEEKPLNLVDMGSGKGYLTFAAAALLGARARVHGVEARAELTELCNRVAQENGFPNLTFSAGKIDEFSAAARKAKSVDSPDVLIALHACDTATDDALAQGIAAGAALIVVSPCCQKELRAQLTAPAVLADALRHGIFQERQAEFVTDALRAQLLEWAGYRTKVFEFISTEHTAKNLMIAAIKTRPAGDAALAKRVREFAAFYGVRSQKLATHLQFPLSTEEQPPNFRS